MPFNYSIKKITMMNGWSHISKNVDCTICRKNLNCDSIYAQKNTSIIVNGKCGHSYHKECIEPWLAKQPYCPICLQKWF